jgi:hypothetical protein
MHFMEHRCGNRYYVDRSITLRFGPDVSPHQYTARVNELSLSGALVRTELKLPKLSRIDVDFGLAKVPAFVIRSLPHGLAIEWGQRAPKAVRALVREHKHANSQAA